MLFLYGTVRSGGTLLILVSFSVFNFMHVAVDAALMKAIPGCIGVTFVISTKSN